MVYTKLDKLGEITTSVNAVNWVYL